MRRKLLFQVSRIPLKALATENGKRETINGRIHNGNVKKAAVPGFPYPIERS
jgi:hypothetical protein